MTGPGTARRTVVVTGANSGLGFVTARTLAAGGDHVVLAVRDVERGRRAAAHMPGSTEVRELDLADLASVRRFAAEWGPRGAGDRPGGDAGDNGGGDGDTNGNAGGASGAIDVLVNNAGIMHVPHTHTADGFEAQIGVNHLGHFTLTNLLLEHLTDRVVTVSSLEHHLGRIDLDDLNWERRRYSRVRAYGQAKLANLLFASELARRLSAAGSPVRSLAAHPGYAATNLQTRTGNALGDLLGRIGNATIATSVDAGARPLVYAATADLQSGTFVGPGRLFGTRGAPAPVGRSSAASDAETARSLWNLSEELTGVRFPAGELGG